MRRFGLIGFPLTHSFSHKYFTEKFEQEGLRDCVYENFPIESIYELKNILASHPDLEGLNVTIPYKQLVLRHLDYMVDTLPVAACNCIKITNGRTTAYNTDIVGFETSLLTRLKPYHQKALVLGNGGATEAVRYVLNKLGISFDIVSREIHDRSTLTYQALTRDIVSDRLLIINTTPVGMYPHVDECPLLPYEALTPRHYLFDLIYNPAKTLFLRKGEERGAAVENGYQMLVLQAEESWRIWNITERSEG
jgi:shikimate dehydrogenase